MLTWVLLLLLLSSNIAQIVTNLRLDLSYEAVALDGVVWIRIAGARLSRLLLLVVLLLRRRCVKTLPAISTSLTRQVLL